MLELHAVQCPRLKQAPLTVTMQAGQHWALLGPNGSGKTTLLHTLAGLLPAKGTILLRGRELGHMSPPEQAEWRALLFQDNPERIPWRVHEYLQVASGVLGMASVSASMEAQLSQRLELNELMYRRVDHLSGGQWQRVQIAAVLMQGSPILLLDEPLNHLDLRHQQQLMQLLEERRLNGSLVLSSLHDVNQAFGRCTHALLFYPDRILAGTAGERIEANQLSALYGLPLERLSAQGREWLLPADLPANRTGPGH